MVISVWAELIGIYSRSRISPGYSVHTENPLSGLGVQHCHHLVLILLRPISLYEFATMVCSVQNQKAGILGYSGLSVYLTATTQQG